jgi:hypothetical protein
MIRTDAQKNFSDDARASPPAKRSAMCRPVGLKKKQTDM